MINNDGAGIKDKYQNALLQYFYFYTDIHIHIRSRSTEKGSVDLYDLTSFFTSAEIKSQIMVFQFVPVSHTTK